MLIIGKPQEEYMQNYIMVDNEVSREFQMNGIMPKYFDGENYYFIRNDELSKFIERSERN